MPNSSPKVRFTIRQLQYFTAVARTGQISLAAATENVTQSAMTSAIAQLERGLDTLLFERGRGGVSLTHAGHLFLQHAHRVLEAAEEASRNPFQERKALSGEIELATSYGVLGYFILPFLSKFQKQNPDVRIVPLELERTDIEHSVQAGRVELALALTSNLSDSKRYTKQVLARSRRQLWVSAANPLADLPLVTLREASAYTYVAPTVDEGDVAAERYWAAANLRPAAFVKTASMEAVREMVALDLGVTILSDMLFRPWSLDGRRIRAIPLKNPIPPMEVGLIWQKGRRLSPLAEALVKYLQAAVN